MAAGGLESDTQINLITYDSQFSQRLPEIKTVIAEW